MLKIKNLGLALGGRDILRQLDLALAPGEIRFLVGASGTGKSTLLRLIAGFEVPDEGSIEIGDQLVSAGGSILAPPHRRGVAMVFQDGAFWPHMTVEAHLRLGLGASIPDRERRDEVVEELLGLFLLADRRSERPGHLSGGERQRLGLARALAQQPRLLLLDEPLAHVDLPAQRELATSVAGMLLERGITAIWVTHRPGEVCFAQGKVSLLRSGKIERDLPVDDFRLWLQET